MFEKVVWNDEVVHENAALEARGARFADLQAVASGKRAAARTAARNAAAAAAKASERHADLVRAATEKSAAASGENGLVVGLGERQKVFCG